MKYKQVLKLLSDKNNDKPPDYLPWTSFARRCWIQSGGEVIRFDPYDYQEKIIDIISTYKNCIIFKSRQLGITELISNYFLWRATYNPAYTSVVLSIGQRESSSIARRVRRSVNSFSGVSLLNESLTNLTVRGGGQIIFEPSTEHAVRGLPSVSSIYFDEAAFVKKIEDLYSAAIPSQQLVKGSNTILCSTPNGRANWFWEKFDAGNDCSADEIRQKIQVGELPPFYWWVDRNNVAKIFVHWRAHPEYRTQNNYLERIKETYKLTDRALNREYNFGLDDSAFTVFPSKLVERSIISPDLLRQPRRTIIGVDPATGGDDYFCSQVWEISQQPYQLIASYRGRKTASAGVEKVLEQIDTFRPEYVVVEANGAGAVIAEHIAQSAPWQPIKQIYTSATNKRVNIDRLVFLVEKGDIQFTSDSYLGDEMVSLIEDKGKIEARGGKHDDTVLAAAMAFALLPELNREVPMQVGTVRFH